MLIKTTNWRSCLLSANVVGDPHGAALMAYCGLYGQTIVAGYGRWRDTLTPYAYGINDFLSLPHSKWDCSADRLCIMPKNKGVAKYINEYAPIWSQRSVNGHGEIPEARDEWVRAASYIDGGTFFLDTAYKSFKDGARQLEGILSQVASIAEQNPVKVGRVVRVHAIDLNWPVN